MTTEEQLLAKYGAEHQKLKTIEELGECTSAISELVNKNNHENRLEVLKEMADVEIMFTQMKLLLGEDDFIKMKAQKLKKAQAYCDGTNPPKEEGDGDSGNSVRPYHKPRKSKEMTFALVILALAFLIPLGYLLTYPVSTSTEVSKDDMFVIPRDPNHDSANPFMAEIKVLYFFKILEVSGEFCKYDQESLGFGGKINKEVLSGKCKIFEERQRVSQIDLIKVKLSY